MSNYICLLGQTPQLSQAELEQLLPDTSIEILADSVVRVDLADAEAAQDLMTRSGGIIKIGHQLDSFPTNNPPPQTQLQEILVEYLQEAAAHRSARLNFGLGEIGRDHLPPIELADLKEVLANDGVNSRYIEGSRHGLSAAVLLNQKVTELLLIQTESELLIAETIVVQDIDAWTFIDRGKPYANRKKGMLPPKVARMMVNIGLGQTTTADESERPLLYDPFCGTGTILMEGLLRGSAVIGSDQDQAAVEGSRENIDWLFHNFDISAPTPPLLVKDVHQVSPQDLPQKVDLIVTEPYLGRQTPQPDFLPRMFDGLTKLYLGAFKTWTALLKPGAVLVVIFPQVESGSKTYNLEGLIDKLAQLGYTTNSEPIEYARPQATVERQIRQFKYQPKK
jgi:tRNA G10  N-methylase Trm11